MGLSFSNRGSTSIVLKGCQESKSIFKDSIVGKDVLTPPALHQTFGLTGGNIFHGAMTLDQVFLTRPIADSKGRAAPSTPVSGLYMCGSGAHPGGGGDFQ